MSDIRPADGRSLGSDRRLLEGALRSAEEELRQELLQIESPQERLAYLVEVTGHDGTLRSRLLSWLADQEPKLENGALGMRGLDELGSGRLVGGRYQLLRELGEGGFGAVYLAQQILPVKRRVALKILKPGMDTRQVVARFEMERQTLALMDHPGIARVFDAGSTETGRPFFVMELVGGEPITEYCKNHQMAIRPRLELFAEVCQAVQHAHQKGIIHRDLKPSNILIDAQAGKAMPKVIDFGIAKATQPELNGHTLFTQEQHLLGTPAYLSPEQASLAGADIDTRSDIYSLGVLLYELLTGSTPFDTRELMRAGVDEMRRLIREREPVRPSLRLNPTQHKRPSPHAIDPDLDWIVLKCLEKDRARRYPTANGLAMDIQRYLRQEPIVARPPTACYRMSKLVRRNPVVASLCLVLVLALACAVIAGTWLSLRIVRAKRDADQANRQLSKTVKLLESEKIEELAADGRWTRPLAWLAQLMRQNPSDPVAASRVLSALSLHNFALQELPPLMHAGPVNSARFSPDQTQILTASDDQVTRFWQRATGRLLAAITNSAPVQSAAYAANGTRVITLTSDEVVHVYNAQTRARILEVTNVWPGIHAALNTAAGPMLFVAHPDQSVSCWALDSGEHRPASLPVSDKIRLLETSEPADCVAVACEDRTVHLFRASTGEPLLPTRQFDFSVANLRFTPDGARLFLPLDQGRRLAIWTLKGANSISESGLPDNTVRNQLTFSPSGHRLATAAWAAPVEIRDPTDLRVLNRPVRPEAQGWAEYFFSHDGSRLAGIAQTGVCRIWDVESGQVATETFEHRGEIHTLEFSSDDSLALTASQDGTARLWDVRMRLSPVVSFPDTAGGGTATLSHDGTRALLSVARDAVQVFEVSSGRPAGPVLRHPGGWDIGHIRGACFSQDDSMILTTGEFKCVRLWDAVSFQLKRELPAERQLVLARFSHNGKWVVVGDRDGRATVWSTETGALLGVADQDIQSVISLDIHPQDKAFVTAGFNGVARCWSLPYARPVGPPMRHQGIVWSALYSPDGRRIVTASADHTARIWDAASGRPLLKPFQHEKDVLLARFSPNNRWVLTTSDDGVARVWDADSGRSVSPALQHSGTLWVGDFTPDSRWIATGSSQDFTARLWDPISGLPISEALPHKGPLGQLEFSPDGTRLLTFGGQRKLWEIRIAPTPVPGWFCDLVEAVAGARLEADGRLQPVSPGIIRELRTRLGKSQVTDFYSRWAKWFLLERMQNPVPPWPQVESGSRQSTYNSAVPLDTAPGRTTWRSAPMAISFSYRHNSANGGIGSRSHPVWIGTGFWRSTTSPPS